MSATHLSAFVPPPGSHLVVLGACGGIGRSLVCAARALGIRVMALDTQRAIDQSPPPDGVETLACDAGWRNYHFVKLTSEEGVVGWSEFDEGFGSPGVGAIIAADKECFGTGGEALEGPPSLN